MRIVAPLLFRYAGFFVKVCAALDEAVRKPIMKGEELAVEKLDTRRSWEEVLQQFLPRDTQY